jgi:hypothetical protein
MSRPKSKGLDYFPHDTGAINNEKIQYLVSVFGATGYALYFAILEKIFRSETAEVDFTKKYLSEIICRSLSITGELLNNFLAEATECGALIKNKRGNYTSNEATKRFNHINELRAKDRVRKGNLFSGGKPSENPRKTDGKPSENVRKESGTDLESVWKVPESKVKESKENIKEKDFCVVAEKTTTRPPENPRFDTFWKTYPARNGKKLEKGETLRKFKLLSESDQISCVQAAKNYSDSQQAKTGYVRDPKRFLTNNFWKDWINPEILSSVSLTSDDVNPTEIVLQRMKKEREQERARRDAEFFDEPFVAFDAQTN